MYSWWRLTQLRDIARVHGIKVPAKSGLQSVYNLLRSHACVTGCGNISYIFQILTAPRTTDNRGIPPLHRTETAMLPTPAAFPTDTSHVVPLPVSNTLTSEEVNDAYLEVADDVLQQTIIREWQQAMSITAVTELVCAVCARRTAPERITFVKSSKIELSLLRNDRLPIEVLPTSYNRDAYGGALLHPKGLTNLTERGDMKVCNECLAQLAKHQMPKYALANWLYYGHEKVPEEVRNAFSESTHVERILVSRARASTISFRFSDIKGHYLYKTPAALSQKCVKGNVAIHPQDATHLSDMLPPGHDAIRDTICAVFVGETKPTAENIEKLWPILVRKSRVKTMIDFLVAHNPMYAVSSTFQGYSQHNMDRLFGDGTATLNQGVPCAMEIGHIKSSDAVKGATEGYIPGEDEGPTSPDDDMLMETVALAPPFSLRLGK